MLKYMEGAFACQEYSTEYPTIKYCPDNWGQIARRLLCVVIGVRVILIRTMIGFNFHFDKRLTKWRAYLR